MHANGEGVLNIKLAWKYMCVQGQLYPCIENTEYTEKRIQG